MIADMCDVVIGVDTHKSTHTYAVIGAATGQLIEVFSQSADGPGYLGAVKMVEMVAPDARCLWAIEGTQSYGAGLTRHLAGRSEQVAEVDHPHKRPRTTRGKSDPIDAVGAARAILERGQLAIPRGFGTRDELRMLMIARDDAVEAYTNTLRRLRSLIVTAPQPLRDRLDIRGAAPLVAAVLSLRLPRKDPECQTAVVALRSLAGRAKAASADGKVLHTQIAALVKAICPELLSQPGVGPISAAQILISIAHPKRLRSAACFRRLAGVAPIPASSGMSTRHRLDRGGDRKLNSALYTVAITRMRCHDETCAYIEKRRREGKSSREARRALTSHIARGLYRLVVRHANYQIDR